MNHLLPLFKGFTGVFLFTLNVNLRHARGTP